MSRRGEEFSGPIKRRSGWLIPAAVFLMTAVLSGFVLFYYFFPSAPELVEEQRAPSDAGNLVVLTVGGQKFHIPANYLPFASARKGGALAQVSLEALLPDLQPYSLGEADAFSSNAADSRLINILIRADRSTLPEQERFDRIYMPLLKDPAGAQALYGLTRYEFRAEVGYRNEELYVAETSNGLMILRCTLPSAVAPSPSCLREMPLAPGLSFSYRFKRAHLERWREMDADLRALIGSFMDKT